VKLFEYAAKELFARHGIPVPPGRAVASPQEARAAAAAVGAAVAVKSQILAGGRGKAGGIRFAATPDEAAAVAGELLGTEVRGYRVEKVLVEKKLSIDREFYLGFAVDGGLRRPVAIFSTEGGVNIEDVPERLIARAAVDPAWGLRTYAARDLCTRAGLSGALPAKIADVASRLYRAFAASDATLAEINPLVVCGDALVAADARMSVDDDALYRHPELPRFVEGTPLELKVKELGLAFVELDGDIAVMANGAGVTMAVIDVLQRMGGRAANFLDAGGGAGVEPTAQAIEVLLSTRPRAVLINIFGGITRCDDVAAAILKVREEHGIPAPLVVRLSGTNEAEGVAMLKQAGMDAFHGMEEAAARAVALARGEG